MTDLAAKTETEAATESQRGSAKTRAVERTAAILKCFRPEKPQLTLTEIAQQIDLNRATVHRFISSLEAEGLLARVGGGKKYQLGPVLVALGGIALRQFDLRDVTRPYLEALSLTTGCTVHLAMLDDESIVYLEKIEPPTSQIQIRSQIGGRRPLHCTALGKAMLSTLTEPEYSETLNRLDLRRYTETTITSLSALREDIAKVRQRGWSLDNHELNELLICVAAPIESPSATRAAISVTMIGVEAGSARFQEACDSVKEAARRISAELKNVS